MADLMIPEVDDSLIEKLAGMARRRGVSVGNLAVEILTASASMKDRQDHASEIAALRASQPAQLVDAVDDVRALRDGGEARDRSTQAA